jgi:hypothetical protein
MSWERRVGVETATTLFDHGRGTTVSVEFGVRGVSSRLGALAVAGLMAVGLAACGADDDRIDAGAPANDGYDFTAAVAPSVAWTGDRLFTYVGYQTEGRSNVAGLVDPRTGSSELLPTPPFDLALQSPVASIVVGHSVLVVGGLCAEPQPDLQECPPATYAAASLDLEDRTWATVRMPEPLAQAGGRREALGVLSDGRAVFRFGPHDAPSYWTFSAPNQAWTEIPAPPDRSDDACLAGDTLVVVTAQFEQGDSIVADDPIATGDYEGDFVANDADDGYVRPALMLADLSSRDPAWHMTVRETETFLIPAGIERPLVSCMEDAAMVHDGIRSIAVVHSTDSGDVDSAWVHPPEPPRVGVFDHAVWTGTELIFLNQSSEQFESGGPSQGYAPDRNTWTDHPGLPLSTGAVVWTGDALAGFPDRLNVMAIGMPSPFFVSVEGS